MNLIQIIDLCLYLGIALFLVGFVLRTIERRRELPTEESLIKESNNIDRAKGEKNSPPNSKRVTLLLVGGVFFICLSALIQVLSGSGPRAPDAAREIEKLKETSGDESSSKESS